MPGARLTVETVSGTLAVIAGKGLRRRYEWDGCALDAHPTARSERWYGALGIYDPAPGLAYLFGGCKGISRPVIEEGQQHFASRTDAEAWLTRYANMFPRGTVWTGDGLVIGWGLGPERAQLNVELWQMCIRGARPTDLPDARDPAIRLRPPEGSTVARLDCVSIPDSEMSEAKRIWEEHWRQADEWAARRGRRQEPQP
jgi:hypothetical protein